MSAPTGAPVHAPPEPEPSTSSPGQAPGTVRRPRRSLRRPLYAIAAVVIVVGATFAADWATGGALLPFLESHPPANDSCYGPPWTFTGARSSSLAAADNASFVSLAAQFGVLMKGCVSFHLNAVSTSEGVSELASGPTVFEIVSGVPSLAEREELPYPTLYFPETVGSIAIVYHSSGLPDELNLTPAALAGIYLGTVGLWTDPTIASVNTVGSSAGPIAPAYLAGTTEATAGLTAYLAETNATWNRTIGTEPTPSGLHGTAVANSSAMLAYVSATPGAIGYLPYGPATATGVTVARVENAADRFALPNATGLADDATAAGEAALAAIELAHGTLTPGPNLSAPSAPGNLSYPLTTFDYVLLYHDLGTAYGTWLTLQGSLWLLWFLAWLAGSGQLGFDGPGAVPMPGVLSSMTLTLLEHVTFGGEPVLTGALGEGEGSGEGGNETGGG